MLAARGSRRGSRLAAQRCITCKCLTLLLNNFKLCPRVTLTLLLNNFKLCPRVAPSTTIRANTPHQRTFPDPTCPRTLNIWYTSIKSVLRNLVSSVVKFRILNLSKYQTLQPLHHLRSPSLYLLELVNILPEIWSPWVAGEKSHGEKSHGEKSHIFTR